MAKFPLAIQRMVEQFNHLPGIGTKTSERFVFFLLRQPTQVLTEYIQSLTGLRDEVQMCGQCFSYSEAAVCSICSDPRRDKSVVCVVAKPPDLWAIESTGEYHGLYHVLGGVINQIEGVDAGQLRVKELVARAGNGVIQELIIATNPDVEGESTALTISQAMSTLPVRLTRIARGLPMGADIEYADTVTLGNALKGRTNIK